MENKKKRASIWSNKRLVDQKNISNLEDLKKINKNLKKCGKISKNEQKFENKRNFSKTPKFEAQKEPNKIPSKKLSKNR